jgi:Holliday junction DNA helicase RuvA
MIRSISGIVAARGERTATIDVHGVGFELSMSTRDLAALPQPGTAVLVHSYLHVKEDALELYGFLGQDALELFRRLISVSGVGPKSALAVLDVASLKDLVSAIAENRPDLLVRAAGIGRKTAERIVLELKEKIAQDGSAGAIARMEADHDLIEALVGLGYRREEARTALAQAPKDATTLEERLKMALGVLSGTRRRKP